MPWYINAAAVGTKHQKLCRCHEYAGKNRENEKDTRFGPFQCKPSCLKTFFNSICTPMGILPYPIKKNASPQLHTTEKCVTKSVPCARRWPTAFNEPCVHPLLRLASLSPHSSPPNSRAATPAPPLPPPRNTSCRSWSRIRTRISADRCSRSAPRSACSPCSRLGPSSGTAICGRCGRV